MAKKSKESRADMLARTRRESLERRAKARAGRAKLEDNAHDEATAQMKKDAGLLTRRAAEQTLPESAPPQN